MGRRNAFTFAKRQRELEKKKKKEAKRALKAQRKDGLDPDLEFDGDPLDPEAPPVEGAVDTPPAEGGVEASAEPAKLNDSVDPDQGSVD
jgi:hypothetical protein